MRRIVVIFILTQCVISASSTSDYDVTTDPQVATRATAPREENPRMHYHRDANQVDGGYIEQGRRIRNVPRWKRPGRPQINVGEAKLVRRKRHHPQRTGSGSPDLRWLAKVGVLVAKHVEGRGPSLFYLRHRVEPGRRKRNSRGGDDPGGKYICFAVPNTGSSDVAKTLVVCLPVRTNSSTGRLQVLLTEHFMKLLKSLTGVLFETEGTNVLPGLLSNEYYIHH